MRRPSLRLIIRAAIVPLAVWGLYLLRANVWFRLYPAVMTAIVLCSFAVSLRRTPLAEVVARRAGEDLDARGVAYCRAVTRFWTFFLGVHLAITVWTVFASHEVWAFYNGFAAYVLIGCVFAGELLLRRRLRHG